MKFYSLRLKPGQELRESIEQFAQAHQIQAGFIATCVAGVSKADLRMAGATPESQEIRHFEHEYEVVSLVGTISIHGCHLHISISDKQGAVWGGHLRKAMTAWTAEIVIGENDDLIYRREPDSATGFKELTIIQRP